MPERLTPEREAQIVETFSLNGYGARYANEDVKLLLNEVDALRAEFAAAREDTQRLDWLDQHNPSQIFLQVNRQDGLGLIECTASVREAIDAALRGKDGQ